MDCGLRLPARERRRGVAPARLAATRRLVPGRLDLGRPADARRRRRRRGSRDRADRRGDDTAARPRSSQSTTPLPRESLPPPARRRRRCRRRRSPAQRATADDGVVADDGRSSRTAASPGRRRRTAGRSCSSRTRRRAAGRAARNREARGAGSGCPRSACSTRRTSRACIPATRSSSAASTAPGRRRSRADERPRNRFRKRLHAGKSPADGRESGTLRVPLLLSEKKPFVTRFETYVESARQSRGRRESRIYGLLTRKPADSGGNERGDMDERILHIQHCMYQYSRAIYRSIRDLIDPYVDGATRLEYRREVLSACEGTMERLASDPHYFAEPGQDAFPGHSPLLPDHGAGAGRLGGEPRRRRRGRVRRGADRVGRRSRAASPAATRRRARASRASARRCPSATTARRTSTSSARRSPPSRSRVVRSQALVRLAAAP